jgi:hypothetical protein
MTSIPAAAAATHAQQRSRSKASCFFLHFWRRGEVSHGATTGRPLFLLASAAGGFVASAYPFLIYCAAGIAIHCNHQSIFRDGG